MVKYRPKKRVLSYTKAIIICHGKSECQMCEYLKSNLRLNIEIYSNHGGTRSIQITSLWNHLDNRIFKTKKALLKKYPKIERNKNTPVNFKIFIIMDTDDCKVAEKKAFIDKSMFKGHWACNLIIPIYNIENLEDLLKRCSVIDKNSDERIKKEYIKIFPTSKKYKEQKNSSVEVSEFYDKIKDDEKSNLYYLIEELRKFQTHYR